MKLFRYEGYKLFHRKSYVLLVLILLLLQIALTLFSTYQNKDPFVHYHTEAQAYLQEDELDVTTLSQELTLVTFYLEYESTLQSEDPLFLTQYQAYCVLHPDLQLRHEFLEGMLRYHYQSNEYQSYRSDKVTKLQNMQYLPMWRLYSDTKKEMIALSIKDYQSLSNYAISPTNFIPFEQYSKQPFTFFLMISFILITCSSLFQVEEETCMNSLTRVYPRGRLPLILTKLAMLVFLTCCGLFLLDAIVLLLYSILYGAIDLQAPLQAFPSLLDTVSKSQIGQWLLSSFFLQLSVYLIFGFLYCCLYQRFRQKLMGFTLFLFFLCVEFLCYQFIPEVSYLSFFKTYNVYAMLQTITWLSFPSYVAIGAIKMSVTTLYILVMFALLISLSIGCCYRYLHPKTKQYSLPFSTKWLQKLCYRTPVHFFHEGIKLFWMNKGIWILIIVIGYSSYYTSKITESQTSFFQYQQANVLTEYETYGGAMNPEKWKIIEDEYEEIQKLKAEYSTLREQFLHQQIDEKEYQPLASTYQAKQAHINAFTVFYEQSKQQPTYVLYPNGYQAVFATQTNYREYRNTFFLCIVLILLFSGIYTIDQQHEEDTLYRLTLLGTTQRRKKKSTLVLMLVIVLVFLVYGVEFLSFLSLYPMSEWNAPFSTILLEPQTLPFPLPTAMPLFAYAILLFLLRFLGTGMASLLIVWLSRRYKHPLSVILVSSLILLFPILLSMIGIQEVFLFSLFDIISGNLFLQQNTSFLKFFLYAILSIVFIRDINRCTKE